jgi:hypothetical protein
MDIYLPISRAFEFSLERLKHGYMQSLIVTFRKIGRAASQEVVLKVVASKSYFKLKYVVVTGYFFNS